MAVIAGRVIRVLVSGFEPFAGAKLNSSQLVVEAIADRKVDGVDLHTVVLPVEFGASFPALQKAIDRIKPDVVISLGQAEGRSAITPEQVAINLDEARIPDNAGAQPRNVPIQPSEPDGLFTSLPIAEIVSSLTASGIPAEISYSAGTFVCNHLFYLLQSHQPRLGMLTGFIHLPLSSEQIHDFPNLPAIPTSQMAAGVEIAIARSADVARMRLN